MYWCPRLCVRPQWACTCLLERFAGRLPPARLPSLARRASPRRRADERLRHVLECELQHLVDPLDRLDLELVLDVLRNLGEILACSRPGSAPCVMPPRCAASSFSFRPPIGSTWPRSVISPVIATSAAHRDLRSAPTPARCTCRCRRSGRPSASRLRARECARRPSGRSPDRGRAIAARLRTTVIAAWIDSCITSPSWPVCVSLPLPGTTAASIVSSSPPTSVHARPVTRPTWSCSSARP